MMDSARLSLVLATGFCFMASAGADVYPAPKGIPASTVYEVTINSKPVFITEAKTYHGKCASYGSFELSGKATVVVHCATKVDTVKLRPTSYGITPKVMGNTITFSLAKPGQISLELNGAVENTLHLFADPQETNRPSRKDPNVIWFAPGVHDVSTLRPKSGQTIYLDRGAYLRCIIPPEEATQQEKDWTGQRVWAPFLFTSFAQDIRICGRGVIDFSGLPWHARMAMWFDTTRRIRIEGITLIGVPNWCIALHRCSDVKITNIKEISSWNNSDGIDICNSQNVLVEDSFLRNNDDVICVKSFTPPPSQPSANITVRKCVIWNERARGLGITSETRTDIRNVLFQNCDIIHDFSTHPDCCALAVLVSDSGTISDITFDNIRVEDCKKLLIRCWVGADRWSKDTTRGNIRGLTFRNIVADGPGAENIQLLGFDDGHRIANVLFERLIINHESLDNKNSELLRRNEYVTGITVK